MKELGYELKFALWMNTSPEKATWLHPHYETNYNKGYIDCGCCVLKPNHPKHDHLIFKSADDKEIGFWNWKQVGEWLHDNYETRLFKKAIADG